MATRWIYTTLLVAGVLAGTAQAQTVQLPTLRVFSVNTTVSVPDRGGLNLGGVDTYRSASVSRGVPGLSGVPGIGPLFGSRSIGSSTTSAGASVTATIIDHHEIDAHLLAEAAARRGEDLRLAPVSDRERRLAAHVAAGMATTTLGGETILAGASLVEIHARRKAVESREFAEMVELFERGLRAEAAGQMGAARCCYATVARRGPHSLKKRARQRLVQINAPRSATETTTPRLAETSHPRLAGK